MVFKQKGTAQKDPFDATVVKRPIEQGPSMRELHKRVEQRQAELEAAAKEVHSKRAVLEVTTVRKAGFFREIFHWAKEKPEQAVFSVGAGGVLGSFILNQTGQTIMKAYMEGAAVAGGPQGVWQAITTVGQTMPPDAVAGVVMYVVGQVGMEVGAVVAAVGLAWIGAKAAWYGFIEPRLNKHDA